MRVTRWSAPQPPQPQLLLSDAYLCWSCERLFARPDHTCTSDHPRVIALKVYLSLLHQQIDAKTKPPEVSKAPEPTPVQQLRTAVLTWWRERKK